MVARLVPLSSKAKASCSRPPLATTLPEGLSGLGAAYAEKATHGSARTNHKQSRLCMERILFPSLRRRQQAASGQVRASFGDLESVRQLRVMTVPTRRRAMGLPRRAMAAILLSAAMVALIDIALKVSRIGMYR